MSPAAFSSADMRRFIATSVVLIAVLVGVDRLAVLCAQSRVATNVRISQQLSQDPDVTIHGFPFLTQLFGGTYDDIEASLHDVRRGSLRIASIDIHLRRAHVPFSDVVSDSVDRVLVERLEGTVTIGYTDLAARTALTLTYNRAGGVIVTGTVRVGGTAINAEADGRIAIEGRRITVGVENVRVGGEPAPAAVEAVARRSFAFSVNVPTLPFAIELHSVRATARGIEITATGKRVVLRALP